jgi:hypothetical protein
MPQSQITYADWKAPAEDGQILIWPKAPDLIGQTLENQRRLSIAEPLVQGVPLHELRRRQRQWIGHDDAAPLIASGHQVELYHPGVWAKDVFVNALAGRVGGAAYHLAVDTDSPKHLHLRWPGRNEPITDDPDLSTAAWTALLSAPTPGHVEHLRKVMETSAANWSFEPAIAPFLASLRRLSLESPALPEALTNATHELNWTLGLRHHALLTSPLWQCEPYLVFVHHVLSRAGAFARQYNAALEDYRSAHGVRSRTRPMPNLAVFDESCEMPFWLDDLATGRRGRPTVFGTGRGWLLELPGGKEFRFDPDADAAEAASHLASWLRASRVRLSPRALMLTLYCRLFLVDQFVHGIGGGRYDQVTDALIWKHFGIEPPHFSVTTATLYFPEAAGRTRVCLPCIRQEGHRLRHMALGPRKMQLVEQINAAPRDSSERRTLFYGMHRELDQARLNNPMLSRWQERLDQAAARDAADEVLFDRELFFALQPRDRLESLIARYGRELA